MDYAIGHKECPDIDRRRGYKDCPCGMRLPNSVKSCDCGHVFYVVRPPKKSKKYVLVDWTTLQVGDNIYIENSDVWTSPEGVMIPMGESGEYQVIRVQKNGLVIYNKTGYGFQDMVNVGYNEKTGITRGAAKVYKK